MFTDLAIALAIANNYWQNDKFNILADLSLKYDPSLHVQTEVFGQINFGGLSNFTKQPKVI